LFHVSSCCKDDEIRRRNSAAPTSFLAQIHRLRWARVPTLSSILFFLTWRTSLTSSLRFIRTRSTRSTKTEAHLRLHPLQPPSSSSAGSNRERQPHPCDHRTLLNVVHLFPASETHWSITGARSLAADLDAGDR
jgi:hypothetical protein